MPIMNVDKNTFNALVVAQAAINYARKALPYGSANQYADIMARRDGGESGAQSLKRLGYNRKAVDQMAQMPHGALPAQFGASAQEQFATYLSALSAGVSLYYGAGNCGEHAYLTYHYLSTFGFPGLQLICASSTSMDHAYTVLSWEGCRDWVVCDAWPSSPQACLWSQFFGNTGGPGRAPAFATQMRHNITPQNMGTDLIGEAFGRLSPSFVKTLPPASRVTGYSAQQILTWLRSEKNGVYNHQSVLNQATPGPVDYAYDGARLSQVAPAGEQWTARLAKVIIETNNQLKVLDPALRYTTSHQVA